MASRASFTTGDETTDQSGNVTPGRTAKLGTVADVETVALSRDAEDVQQSFMASGLHSESSCWNRRPLHGDDGCRRRQARGPRRSGKARPDPNPSTTRRGRPAAGAR